MVDATVSTVLEKLDLMIEKIVRDEVCLLNSTGDQANKLSKKLKGIQKVLGDAERKMVTDPKVKRWLDKLQVIFYDIDDVLDEWDQKNVNLQMKKVSSSIKSVYLCFKHVVERCIINLNIKQLNEHLDSIRQQNDDEFNFIPNVSRDYQEFRRTSSISFVNVCEVYGRNEAKKVLLSKLLTESSNQIENGVQVISIVGVGGMGKTTLAQLVFNDDQIKDNFQEKIWVCVSDPFDHIKITRILLETLNKETSNRSQFQTLAEAISGKKFLLVLDDVWTEDDKMWKPLKICLENNGSPGSKILVTTRKTKVAQVMGSNQMQIHSLEPLRDSDCWSILSQIAFRGRTEIEREILKETGLEIVKKCKGLPLAAKVIGSLLGGKCSFEEWRNVLESKVWEMEIARTNIFSFLVLSYDELQPMAKRCFSYCAIFPKDSKINVENLVRMWWAQGFVSSNGGSDDAELKGREIFDDLAMRSFFQDFKNDSLGDNIISCKMHDIVHDFAQFLTENECLIVENVGAGDKLADVQNIRHLNLLLHKVEDETNLIPLYHEKCRSFLLSTEYAIHTDLVVHLKRVRVLILYDCELEEIPSEIGYLIHLRYLDFSRNKRIKDVPETISDLYNLQTLIIEWCPHLCRLPQGIHKLRNLRHLLNNKTDCLFEFPQKMKELINLWTLSHIHASRNNLELLMNLNHLRGSLRLDIEDLDEADHIVAAMEADLKSKKLIRKLELFSTGSTQYQVIEALHPHPNLQILKFATLGYIPEWISTITSLRKLTIGVWSWEGISSLPALANLPLLEDLTLCFRLGMERLMSHELLRLDSIAPTQSSYAFPKMKRLCFDRWTEWEEWEDISKEEENNIINISIFPCLEVLTLFNCPKLKTLPHRLLRKVASSSSSSSLKRVLIVGCNNLLIRYKDLEGISQDPRKTSHIPISYFRQVV